MVDYCPGWGAAWHLEEFRHPKSSNSGRVAMNSFPYDIGWEASEVMKKARRKLQNGMTMYDISLISISLLPTILDVGV